MALRAKLLRTFLATTLLLAVGACKKDIKKPPPPGPDPDTNSGPDAKRGGAKLMYVNKAETDSVSWPKLLRTKWKRLEIAKPGIQNILDCSLKIDNTGADLNLDLFNSLGTQIGFTPGPAPNKLKKLAVEIEEVPGTYFVRVTAAQPKDESDFSVICEWPEQPEVVAQAPPDKKPRKKTPGQPKPVAEQTFQDKVDNGTEGRIVQAYRDGAVMKLNLDKGSAARVQVGTEGTILEGKSGRVPLDGGTFKIVKVVGDSQSVAESNVRSTGKNNRIVLFLK